MFNKFRNNYVMTNMAVISTVIIIAFTIIYSITYNNTFNIARNNFDNVVSTMPSMSAMEDISLINNSANIILIDESHNFVSTNKNIENTKQVIQESISNNDVVIIKDDSKTYFSKHIVLNEPFYVENSKVTGYIVFSDLTNVISQLNTLLRIMIIILIVVLGFVFLICVYLANKSVRNIKEAWDKQRQFIADASHELKTPIAIITSNVDALALESNKNKWIDNIKQETERMNSLISDLLYLAKIEDFEVNLETSPLDLSKLINNILLIYEVKAFEENINLSSNIQDNIVLKADEDKLKQLIHILIDNALKYTNESGSIEISLTQEYNQVTYSIENTGHGINEKDIPFVFDRFYKSDQSRVSTSNSYGLGLSIAKAIVLRMDGEIFVQSVENQKTKFTIIFDL